MIQVNKSTEIEINDESFIDVEVNYRCYFSPTQAFYPMEVSGEIYKGNSLQQFIDEFKKDYEKNYEKVEVVEVFVSKIP